MWGPQAWQDTWRWGPPLRTGTSWSVSRCRTSWTLGSNDQCGEGAHWLGGGNSALNELWYGILEDLYWMSILQNKSSVKYRTFPMFSCTVSLCLYGLDTDGTRLGSPAHSAGGLSSPCRRFWRRAIHFFLVSLCFCGSQSPIGSRWLFPLARYWLVQHNDDRVATESSQSRTIIWTRPIDPASCAIHDWAWSGNSQAMTVPYF